MAIQLTQIEIEYLRILLDLKKKLLDGDEAEYHRAMCESIQNKLAGETPDSK